MLYLSEISLFLSHHLIRPLCAAGIVLFIFFLSSKKAAVAWLKCEARCMVFYIYYEAIYNNGHTVRC